MLFWLSNAFLAFQPHSLATVPPSRLPSIWQSIIALVVNLSFPIPPSSDGILFNSDVMVIPTSSIRRWMNAKVVTETQFVVPIKGPIWKKRVYQKEFTEEVDDWYFSKQAHVNFLETSAILYLNLAGIMRFNSQSTKKTLATNFLQNRYMGHVLKSTGKRNYV